MNCPICDSESIGKHLSCVDHTVSKETFEVGECSACGFLFTLNRPEEFKIGEYYKSDAYVSHTDKEAKGLVNFLYRNVREFTLKKKVRLVKGLGAKRLLDVGCGTGHFAAACKMAGLDVLGLEPDDHAREIAINQNQVDARPLDTLKDLTEKYEVITLWHVLEHVYHLQRDFSRFVDLLPEGGCLVIAVPNPESWDARHYGREWAAWDVPRHLYHFRKRDVEALAGKHGLVLEKVLPMKFDSYYVSMLSEQIRGKGGVGAFISGMWNGLRSNLNSGSGYSSQIYVLRKPGRR